MPALVLGGKGWEHRGASYGSALGSLHSDYAQYFVHTSFISLYFRMLLCVLLHFPSRFLCRHSSVCPPSMAYLCSWKVDVSHSLSLTVLAGVQALQEKVPLVN